VMRSWSEIKASEPSLGKCTTEVWTEEQQAAGSKVISYILIQMQNRTDSSSSDRLDDMMKAVPLNEGLNKHPNFVQHRPEHPFLSILFDFRVRPVRKEPVEMLWTVSTLQDARKAAVKKAVSDGKIAAGTKPAKTSQAKAEEIAEKSLVAAEAAKTRVKIAKYQIPIVSFGLDGTAFKCLETRPQLANKLNDLLCVSVDPLDKLKGPPKRELRESRVCITGEGELPKAK
jgi:hypothetical protein